MNKVATRFTSALLALLLVGSIAGCDGFLDVVPDNVATIDQAFNTRETALRYLFTLYSYMPNEAVTWSTGRVAGDAFWFPNRAPWFDYSGWQIARGNQTVVNPLDNAWQGGGLPDLYEAIRQCNQFLEGVDAVPDRELTQREKTQWKAEARFLKGYYHFYLTRMYGPIVLAKEALPVSSDAEAVNRPRVHVDTAFTHAMDLMEEAAADLPDRVQETGSQLGRVTQTIALSVRAKAAVTAASPLFNGNPDYQGFTSPGGEQLFDVGGDEAEKWRRALEATTEAIVATEGAGFELYEFASGFIPFGLTDTTVTRMSIRNSVAAESSNPEAIWAYPDHNTNTLQHDAFPRALDPEKVDNFQQYSSLAPTLRIAEMFYTKNGLPIDQDQTWEYADRYELQTVPPEERYNMQVGRQTVKLHFDREPRFYANLGFDGGKWYGQGRLDDENMWYVANRLGERTGAFSQERYSITGYFAKKLIQFETIPNLQSGFAYQTYPWPRFRLADLYLLHAEALNEVNGPTQEVYEYVNRVRDRAGIPAVQESWSQYSTNPSKHTSKLGMREIIQQERLIELAHEGHRFWDLRRWKRATENMNEPIRGWNVLTETAQEYYQITLLYNPTFSLRDYLWPLSENVILSNTNVNQNPGW